MKKPATITAVLLVLLLFCETNGALAASGGSTFSSESLSYSSSSLSSYSSFRASYSSIEYTVRGARTLGPNFSDSATYKGSLYVARKVGSGCDVFGCVILVFAAICFVCGCGCLLEGTSQDDILTNNDKTSVLKLQVGLLGSGRSLQQDLDRLAESADTTTSKGLTHVLTEATMALLRHPDYCISSYSSVDVKQSREEGEKGFQQLCFEEGGKFDEETLINVNGMKRKSSKIPRASGFSNEFIVVTILVAAKGTHKLKPINGKADLKEALQKLGSIPRNQIKAVEVLWTPQNEKDALSEKELLEDYPLLRPFGKSHSHKIPNKTNIV